MAPPWKVPLPPVERRAALAQEQERSQFGYSEDVRKLVAGNVCHGDLHPNPRTLINETRRESGSAGILGAADELKPVKDRRGIRLDILWRWMGPHAFADNDVAQAIPVQVSEGQRVRLRKA